MMMSLFSLHYTALYLSLCFVIVIVNVRLLFSPIAISFCRKSVHSLLSLTTTTKTKTKTNHHNHQSFVSPNPVWWSKGLIGLLDPATDDSSANVFDYSSSAAGPERKDPGGIGLLDAAVDGLASCTESLGSESSDERRSDGECQLSPPPPESGNAAGERRRRKRSPRRFPPTLPSLDRNGQPSFFLRPVRKDGRLELTEIRISRPEILRAHRGDGRLRLHLIADDRDMDCIQEEDDETDGQDQDEDRLFGGGDQGFRRCHEEVVSHRWRPQQQQRHCVTTT